MGKMTIAPWVNVAGLDDQAVRDRRRRGCGFSPAADLLERKDGFLILIDLPGLSLEDVSIEIHGNVLTVSGATPPEPACGCVVHHLVERGKGQFRRSFTLAGLIRRRDVKATLKDGLLTIDLPKALPVKRTIHLD